MHVARLSEFLPVDLSEAGRRAQLEQPGCGYARGVERHRPAILHRPVVGVVRERPELADPLGALVVRAQRRRRKGPAAIRHVRPGLEVEGIEGPAKAAPVVGRTAEVPESRDVERGIGMADHLADIKPLSGPVELQPAALQQTDLDGGAGELARDGDARGAGADHANVGFKQVLVARLPGPKEHPSSPPRCWSGIVGLPVRAINCTTVLLPIAQTRRSQRGSDHRHRLDTSYVPNEVLRVRRRWPLSRRGHYLTTLAGVW